MLRLHFDLRGNLFSDNNIHPLRRRDREGVNTQVISSVFSHLNLKAYKYFPSSDSMRAD
jgi:hypothetical protein